MSRTNSDPNESRVVGASDLNGKCDSDGRNGVAVDRSCAQVAKPQRMSTARPSKCPPRPFGWIACRTRECLALEVDTCLPSRRVTRTLDAVIAGTRQAGAYPNGTTG